MASKHFPAAHSSQAKYLSYSHIFGLSHFAFRGVLCCDRHNSWNLLATPSTSSSYPSHRLRGRAVIFPKSLVLKTHVKMYHTAKLHLGHCWVEHVHLVAVMDPVRQPPDHQVLARERLQHGHFFLTVVFIH